MATDDDVVMLKLAGYEVRFDQDHEAWEWVNRDIGRVSASWMDNDEIAWDDALHEFNYDLMEMENEKE